jgi:Tol biopolymer transport system component
MIRKHRSIIMVFSAIFLLSACVDNQASLNENADLPSPTPTSTTSPTSMPTSTVTPTMTPSPTPTSVFETALLGRTVAYSLFSQSGIDLMLRDKLGNKIRLTDGRKLYLLPFWSKDGNRLAFFSLDPFEETIGIMVCDQPFMADNCSEVATGLVNSQSLAWAFDSQTIYYSDVQANGAEMDIYALVVNSGSITNLTLYSSVWDDAPSASQTEDRVAFVSDRDVSGKGTDEIWMMRGNGSGLERLTFNHEFFWEDTDPVFSPDGKYIAFYRFGILGEDYPGGTPGIWLFDIAKGEEQLIFEDEGVFLSDPPVWSQDSKSIVYSSGLEEKDLQLVSVPDGNVIRLTNLPGEETFPSWSSDSEWILFTNINNDEYSLYLVSKDGSILEMIDFGSEIGFGSISPGN